MFQLLRFLILIGCGCHLIEVTFGANNHNSRHEPSFRELSQFLEDDLIPETVISTSSSSSSARRNKKSVPNSSGDGVFSTQLAADLHHQQCKTLETTIQVSKEDKTSTGDLLRVCEGVIKVNKCEGVCLSNLRPSVNTATGLLKVEWQECICCREGQMHRKEVNLEICFDAEGNRLAGQSMTVTIPEPKDCGCFKCS